MFQKIYFQTKQARDLENYKGKTVVVHAVRPTHNAEGFQKFKYFGVIDPDMKEEISISLGYFVLNVGGVHINCDFIVKDKANINECFVMSVEDPETNKVIYENGTSLKFEGEELVGTGKINLSEEHYLNKFNGQSAILLNTFQNHNQNYMKLKFSDRFAYIGSVPKDFKLLETNFKLVKENDTYKLEEEKIF